MDLKEENSNYEVLPTPDSVWICHNPWSEVHGDLCTPECLESGIASRYCWLLTPDDCAEPLKLQWQRESCHLLNHLPPE